MNYVNAHPATCPACGKPLTGNHRLMVVIMVPVFDAKTGKWVKEPTHPGNPNWN